MLIVTHQGREWKFPSGVLGDDQARDLVRAYLSAEASGSEPGGPITAQLTEFAREADIQDAEWESMKLARQSYDATKAEESKTDGERIVVELKRLREAVLAPRVIVRDEFTGEPVKAVPALSEGIR